jgi:hypothetical protein
MRREVKIIDKPSLVVHIDYDYITVGELGNVLIRLQAALRSVAGMSPGEYDGRYYKEQPRFVTSVVHTKQSIDIDLVLAILAVAMAAPGAVYMWRRFASDVFRWFKATILGMGRGQVKDTEDSIDFEGLKIEVTKGKIDLEASRPFLKKLTPKQKRAIANFLWSLTGPARRVDISDDESEISIEWPKKTKSGE